MAIRTFKEIIDNKGYRISSKDREIFEQGTLQSFFGFSDSDMIEFIIYDANDNQLPQGENGKLVRYIPLSSENIKDYFLVADGTLLQSFRFPKEYFIDVERLIKEAGYNNGIFKTQITLLNKRVGYDALDEKLWIKEISPSRTEVKLFPINNATAKKTDLLQRFNIMVNESDFKDDVVSYIPSFIESIDSSQVSYFIKNTYGESWFNKFISEFGINGFDNLIDKIYSRFSQKLRHEFSAGNIAKRKSPQLSKQDIYKIAQRILIDSIKVYLPKRAVKYSSDSEITFDASNDVSEVVNRRESDVIINPKEPGIDITKTKPVNNNLDFEKKVKEIIPKGEPMPIFKEANPTKVKKISDVQRGIGKYKKRGFRNNDNNIFRRNIL